jgi:hypothetical protein
MLESVWHNNEVETPVEMKDVHLLSIDNHKFMNDCQGEGEVWMGKK